MNAHVAELKNSPKQVRKPVKMFDRDRIEKSLNGKITEIPKGLSFEEFCGLVENAK